MYVKPPAGYLLGFRLVSPMAIISFASSMSLYIRPLASMVLSSTFRALKSTLLAEARRHHPTSYLSLGLTLPKTQACCSTYIGLSLLRIKTQDHRYLPAKSLEYRGRLFDWILRINIMPICNLHLAILRTIAMI